MFGIHCRRVSKFSSEDHFKWSIMEPIVVKVMTEIETNDCANYSGHAILLQKLWGPVFHEGYALPRLQG
jgi:hypothetical protein